MTIDEARDRVTIEDGQVLRHVDEVGLPISNYTWSLHRWVEITTMKEARRLRRWMCMGRVPVRS